MPGTVWTIDKRYVLKRRDAVSNISLAKLTFELDVLDHLMERQLPVSRPLATGAGDHFIPWQDDYYSLSHYIANEPLAAESVARANTMRNYGDMIARLHQGLATIPAGNIPTNIRRNNLFHEILLKGVPDLKRYLNGKSLERFTTIQSTIESDLAQLYTTVPMQLIHRDCHSGNFLTLNQQVVGIIDWDQLSLGPPLLELAYFAVQLAKHQIHNSDYMASWLNDWQQLLVGYDAQSSLTQDDKQSLTYFLLTIPLLFIGWLLDTRQFHYVSLELDAFFWLFEQHAGGRLV